MRAVKRHTLRAVDVSTGPFPGFATDLQPPLVAMLLRADGRSLVNENLYEGRFNYLPELARMGADVDLDGSVASVRGVPKLSGADVVSTDLRAGAALVVAGLGAEGETRVSKIHYIDRGYVDIVGKLRDLGADIERRTIEVLDLVPPTQRAARSCRTGTKSSTQEKSTSFIDVPGRAVADERCCRGARARTHRARTHRARTHRARTHRARTHRARTHRARTHRARTHRLPERIAPERIAPERVAPERIAPERIAPDRIAVVGDVPKPGFYPLDQAATLLDAIVRAGGVRAKPATINLKIIPQKGATVTLNLAPFARQYQRRAASARR